MICLAKMLVPRRGWRYRAQPLIASRHAPRENAACYQRRIGYRNARPSILRMPMLRALAIADRRITTHLSSFRINAAVKRA